MARSERWQRVRGPRSPQGLAVQGTRLTTTSSHVTSMRSKWKAGGMGEMG